MNSIMAYISMSRYTGIYDSWRCVWGICNSISTPRMRDNKVVHEYLICRREAIGSMHSILIRWPQNTSVRNQHVYTCLYVNWLVFNCPSPWSVALFSACFCISQDNSAYVEFVSSRNMNRNLAIPKTRSAILSLPVTLLIKLFGTGVPNVV